MRTVAPVGQNVGARAADILKHVEYRLVETPAEREVIYRLRYRAYLKEGAIEPNSSGMIVDRFDELPNSWIFGIYLDGELASSIRISVATADQPHTPAVDAFPDLLEKELARGKTIVDPNRFVADPSRVKRNPELPYVTVRLGYVACGHFQADIGTATVRAEHQAFYRRVFLQKPLCPPRPYPSLVKPLCLMAADYPEVRDRIFQRYPYFRSSVAERNALFGPSRLHPRRSPVMHDPSIAQASPLHNNDDEVTLQPGHLG